METKPKLGGSRPGAGRPRGAQNKRTLALSDRLLAQGKCPAEALVRIAERAEANGETALAVDAWKAVLPYVHAKPKAFELDPASVVLLARDLAEARAALTTAMDVDFGMALDRAEAKLAELRAAER